MQDYLAEISEKAFSDALEGRNRYASLSDLEQKDYQKKNAYVYGFFKGIDAAIFLGVKNQHTLLKKNDD